MTAYENDDQFLSYWPHHVGSWKRNKKPKGYGRFRHKFINDRAVTVPGVVHLSFNYDSRVKWQTLFESLCELLKPQLGMLHLYTQKELDSDCCTYSFKSGIFGSLWKPTIPGFGWVMVGGHNFYDKFMQSDVDDLGVIRKDFDDYCTVQIAQSEEEILSRYCNFAQRRSLLTERLPIIAPCEFSDL